MLGARSGHRDELILRDRRAADSGSSESSGSVEPFSERLWSLMDYYDPTSIVDNTGAVIERYSFSAFGLRSILAPNFSPRAVSDYAWDFAFKGQFFDLEKDASSAFPGTPVYGNIGYAFAILPLSENA